MHVSKEGLPEALEGGSQCSYGSPPVGLASWRISFILGPERGVVPGFYRGTGSVCTWSVCRAEKILSTVNIGGGGGVIGMRLSGV